MSTPIEKSSLGRRRLLLAIACGLVALCETAVAEGINALQDESEGVSETSQDLVGHWRFTKIGFENPRDEHLVLHADGTAENWFVTESGHGEISTGNWSAEGETLTLSFEGYEEASFTFFEGGLVLPNIPNQRQIWEHRGENTAFRQDHRQRRECSMLNARPQRTIRRGRANGGICLARCSK